MSPNMGMDHAASKVAPSSCDSCMLLSDHPAKCYQVIYTSISTHFNHMWKEKVGKWSHRGRKASVAGTNRMDAHLENRMGTSQENVKIGWGQPRRLPSSFCFGYGMNEWGEMGSVPSPKTQYHYYVSHAFHSICSLHYMLLRSTCMHLPFLPNFLSFSSSRPAQRSSLFGRDPHNGSKANAQVLSSLFKLVTIRKTKRYLNESATTSQIPLW